MNQKQLYHFAYCQGARDCRKKSGFLLVTNDSFVYRKGYDDGYNGRPESYRSVRKALKKVLDSLTQR